MMRSEVMTVPMTSVDLPAELVEQAKLATGQKTVRGAITVALEQVVARARQADALEALAGMPFLSDVLDRDVRAAARR
jgi:hypothetical protein